ERSQRLYLPPNRPPLLPPKVMGPLSRSRLRASSPRIWRPCWLDRRSAQTLKSSFDIAWREPMRSESSISSTKCSQFGRDRRFVTEHEGTANGSPDELGLHGTRYLR